MIVKMRLILFTSLCCLVAAVATAAETPAAPAQPAAAKESAAATETAPRLYSVEELYKNCGDLNKKPVAVRGRAVKVTSGIQGKTWTHVQDGTGEKANGTNDIIGISPKDQPVVGEVITMTGTLTKTGESRYKCVIEDATISQ